MFHHKTRPFKCFSVQNLICASVNFNLKLHIYSILPKTRLFVRFTEKNQLCASANADFK